MNPFLQKDGFIKPKNKAIIEIKNKIENNPTADNAPPDINKITVDKIKIEVIILCFKNKVSISIVFN